MGEFSKYFKIGDEKTIRLSNGENITVQVVAFNHDKIAGEEGTAGVTFIMKNLLAEEYSLSGYQWAETTIRRELIPELINTFPKDLQSAITNVVKKSKGFNAFGNYLGTFETEDSLWIPSLSEVIDTSSSDESKVYEYFKNNPSELKKKLANGSGDYNTWWLRTAVKTFSGTGINAVERYGFNIVLPDGTTSYQTSISSGGIVGGYVTPNGICLGFCI